MLLIGLIVLGVAASAERCPVDPSFPPWFKLGAATASYQIEGAWNVTDKSDSIWDVFTHDRPGVIKDNSTGDVACNSYHLWRRDVEMAAEMGLDFYRFSLSWPRLMPKGSDYYVSEDGARYYNDLINSLLACGIEPVVTLFHWDLPETLQNLGGWTNPLIADWFANYARVAFSLFGDRIKTWLTINEPVVMCDFAYDAAILAPGIKEPRSAKFLCSKNVLLAHAKAWRVYDEEFKHLYHGKVAIANHLVWYDPKSPEYIGLTDNVFQFVNGRFLHPIYTAQGGWPPALVKAMAEDSARMGHRRSQLPPFTDYEKNLIRGTFDFIAFNYYTSRVVRPAKVGEEIPHIFISGVPQLHAIAEPHPSATYGHVKEMAIYPEGLRKMLISLKANYGDIEMIITENGYSSPGNDLNDQGRVSYIRDHLEQVLFAIKLDYVRVVGYTHWSLMDNFEWMDGYTTKYGLYEVNFMDPQRTRTARSSAHYYTNIIKYRHLDICTA